MNKKLAELKVDKSADYYDEVAEALENAGFILAYALIEERIRGKLDSDTTFEKNIIRDVKRILNCEY